MAIAQQHVSAASIAILNRAEAVRGGLIAALLPGETLGLVRSIGCCCIILGVIIAALLPACLSHDLRVTSAQKRQADLPVREQTV